MTMGHCDIEDEQILATVLTILACMIDVIGFAAPYWYFDDSGKEDIYFGIWQYCTSNPATSCIELPNIQAWQVVVQAMESIGLVFLFLALFFLYPKLFCCERSDCLRYLVVCFLLSSAWQVVVQAMESIGLVFLFLALFFLYPKLFCCERSDCLRYLVVCFLLSSATFVLIGVIIYGTMAPLDWIDNIYFGFCFVIISAGIAVTSACFICL